MKPLTLVKDPPPRHACCDCGTETSALRMTWDDGPVVLRCPPCLDAWFTAPRSP